MTFGRVDVDRKIAEKTVKNSPVFIADIELEIYHKAKNI